MGVIDDLAARLAAAFPDHNIVPNPVDVVPSIPAIVIYPDDPYVTPGTVCDFEVNVQIAVFQTRMNDRDSLDIAIDTLAGIESAIGGAGGAWQQMNLQPTEIGGVQYLAALHSAIMYRNP